MHKNGLKETTTIPVNKSFQYDDVMREQREIIYAERYDVITANRDLAPEIKAMIKRTIKRIVEGASHSSKEERVEAILNLPNTIWFRKIRFLQAILKENLTRKSSITCMHVQKKSMLAK